MAGDDDYLVRKAVVDRPAVEKGHLMKHGFLSAFTRFAVTLATLVFLAWGGTASADDRNFTVVNNTGYPIKGLFVNPPGDNVFNDNELSAVLAEGASFAVKFSGADKGCTWNIKVTWTDSDPVDVIVTDTPVAAGAAARRLPTGSHRRRLISAERPALLRLRCP